MIEQHLEEQMVNELRAKLNEINKNYEGYFHIQLLTLVDMKQDTCLPCNEDPFKPKCLRAVFGYEKEESDEQSDNQQQPDQSE